MWYGGKEKKFCIFKVILWVKKGHCEIDHALSCTFFKKLFNFVLPVISARGNRMCHKCYNTPPLQISTHPLGHEIKQAPPLNYSPPLILLYFLKIVGIRGKTVSIATFFKTFYASITANSVQYINLSVPFDKVTWPSNKQPFLL